MSLFTRVARSRLAAWLTVVAAIVVGAIVFGLPTPDNPAPVSTTGLSVQWQSTQVERLQEQLPARDVQPAIVVVSRDDGAALTDADRAAVTDRAGALGRLAVGGQVSPAQVSPDGTVALLAVPLDTAGGQQAVADEVAQVRDAVGGLPDGLTVEVTGAPAFTADLTKVFEGADITLLAVTAGVVAVLLLITYRSPFLWIVPLIVVAATEQITLRAVDTIVPAVGINLQEGAVTGIASVLVFGAATDYALLLIARYREELRRDEDRFAAMRAAVRRTAEPILASGGTVVARRTHLLLSEQETNRALAVACATGVVFAMLSALFVLPAVLVHLRPGAVLAVRAQGRRPGPGGQALGPARRGRDPPPGAGRRARRPAARRPRPRWPGRAHRPVRDRTVPGQAGGGRRSRDTGPRLPRRHHPAGGRAHQPRRPPRRSPGRRGGARGRLGPARRGRRRRRPGRRGAHRRTGHRRLRPGRRGAA